MDVFDLMAVLSLDSSKYDDGLKNAKGSASEVGGKIAKGLGTAAKVGAAALTAAASGVAALAGAATNAYADFEQLEGGIETLFGDSAQKVMENASNAFSTAGQSMNEYMETSIQSAAALINSLGGDQAKAADLMDLSITDMADNVNKMGTTMEAVQNAYRGFSRGNFTMLDNLALGFAGTKEGMQELIDKANELRDAQDLDLRHLDINSYADIVQAIHEVQDAMGITGTTAKEASETISGSLASMKAAWTNVLTGIADENADFDSQIDALVTSVESFADNIIPRIEVAIGGVGKLISALVPKIAEELPKLFNEIAPSLIKSAMSLIQSLTQVIPMAIPVVLEIVKSLSDILIDQAPLLIDTVVDILLSVIDGLTRALPEIIPSLVDAVLNVIERILDNLPAILDSILTLITTVSNFITKEGIPHLLERLPEIISGIVKFIIKAIPQIILAINQITAEILKELPNIIQMIVEMIPEIVVSIIEALVESIPDLVVGFVELFSAFVIAVPLIVVELVKVLPQLITAFIDAFKEHGPELKQAFVDMIPNMLAAFSSDENTSLIFEKVSGFFTKIGEAIEEFFRPAIEVMLSIWNWFSETFGPLINAFKELFSTVFQAIQIVVSRIWEKMVNKVLEIWNPIWEKISPVLDKIKNGIKIGFDFIYDKIKGPLDKAKALVSNIFNTIKTTISNIITNIVDKAKSWGTDLIDNFIGGIKNKISALTETISGVSQKIKDFIGFSEPKEGPLSNFHTFAPDMMELFAKGIADNTDLITDQIEKSFDFGKQIVDVQKAPNSDIMGSNGGDTARIIDLLTQLVDKEAVKISPDFDGIFDIVKEREKVFRKATGYA